MQRVPEVMSTSRLGFGSFDAMVMRGCKALAVFWREKKMVRDRLCRRQQPCLLMSWLISSFATAS